LNAPPACSTLDYVKNWPCLFCAIIATSVAGGEATFWQARFPTFNYDSAKVERVVSDIEAFSKDRDPSHVGIRMIVPNREESVHPDTLTLHLADVTLLDAVLYVSEVLNYSTIRDDQNIFFIEGGGSSGPIPRHRAGVVGRLIDTETGQAITSAVFRTCPGITNSVLITTNGDFVAALDVPAYRPRCGEMQFYRYRDDHYDLAVSAPGYESITLEVDGSDGSDAAIAIKMKRARPGAATEPEFRSLPRPPPLLGGRN
jgi:hypothetical protein